VSRQWDDSSLIQPPAISGVTPGFHGSAPTVTPSNLPAAVVQVAQPPAAPDPVGLAAAMTLLGQSNIFRDMSGSAALSQLLSGLTSGVIDLNKAQGLAAQAKKQLDSAGTQGSEATRSKADEKDAGRQIDRLDAIRYAADKGLITDGQKQDAAVGVLGGEQVDTESGTGGSGEAGTGPTDAGTIPENPNIALRAVDQGKNAVLLESYQRFQGDPFFDKPTQLWFWSQNHNLLGAADRPASAPITSVAWASLGFKQKTVLANLAGLDADKVSVANVSVRTQIAHAYEGWPKSYAAVFWGGGTADTNTCNIYVGEVLLREGVTSLNQSSKYWSAHEIWEGMHPRLHKVSPSQTQPGDISSQKRHVEIVTEVDPVNETFCTIGGYRQNPIMGTPRCNIDLNSNIFRFYRIR
jgi:hypothetical protein